MICGQRDRVATRVALYAFRGYDDVFFIINGCLGDFAGRAGSVALPTRPNTQAGDRKRSDLNRLLQEERSHGPPNPEEYLCRHSIS